MNLLLNETNHVTSILISLSALLLSGFAVTRITKILKLPNVTGFILAGILIGPHGLNVIPKDIIENMSFIGDVALAFIAFDVGKFLRKETFQKTGTKSIIITLFESIMAGLLITLSMRYFFKLDWSFSLLLGAIATATAPASTMMTINQYKAKGDFVNTLLHVVALDDMVCLIVFSMSTAFITASELGSPSIKTLLMPIAYNLFIIFLGFVAGLILKLLFTEKRSKDNKLILTTAMLLGISGIASIFHISPLLSCMVFGATYLNITQDIDLFKQINNFTPPIFSIFFLVAGINLDIGSLSSLGIIGVAYFLIRIIGKYLGAYMGGIYTKSPDNITKYLGLALIPQAGVAIGLAFLGQRILPPDLGNRLMTIILSSSVLYEMIGPVSAKLALVYAGAIPSKKAPMATQNCLNEG